MEEAYKFCSACGAQNNLSAQFCQRCGARYDGAPPPPVVRQQSRRPYLRLLLLLVVAFFGCAIFGRVFMSLQGNKTPSTESTTLTGSPAPTATLNVQGDEKQSSAESVKGMPEYAQVASMASKIGFQLSVKSNADSSFIAEATKFIDGREFKFVVMGPSSDRVDTIRIQAWGVQTRQARQQLEKWATQMLSSLNRGQLPRDFIRQLYAGSNVGDDGVSNGFCNVQVLQKPITPGRPSASDRITIDLIFDKTN